MAVTRRQAKEGGEEKGEERHESQKHKEHKGHKEQPEKQQTSSKAQASGDQTAVPRGKPKSGRFWKPVEQQRSSAMVKKKKKTWARKMKEREELKAAKLQHELIKKETERKEKERKEKRRESIRRKLENERKAEVTQQITNPRKLRKMSKRQLRRIEKR